MKLNKTFYILFSIEILRLFYNSADYNFFFEKYFEI